MAQDALGHDRRVEERDQAKPATAVGAGQHVEAKGPAHQVGPSRARAVVGWRWRRQCFSGACHRRDDRCLAMHHLRAPRGPRRQHAVAQHPIDPRARHEHRQTLKKRGRLERQRRRAIRPRMAELQHDLTVGPDLEAIVRHRRAQGVATHALQPIPVAGGHEQTRVQVEALPPGMTGAQPPLGRAFRRSAAAPGVRTRFRAVSGAAGRIAVLLLTANIAYRPSSM